MERPTPGQRQYGERQTLRQAVLEHCLRQDERANESEDGGGSEGRQDRSGRRNTQNDDGGNSNQPADRDWHGLADPQNDDAEQDRGEQLLGGVHVRGPEGEDDGDRRGKEETDGLPGPLKPLLTGRECLFAEGSEGASAEQRRFDVGAGRLPAARPRGGEILGHPCLHWPERVMSSQK